MPHNDAIVVMTTLSSADEAVKLVRELLERRLIACGTVLPSGRSLYRWQGKIERSSEVLLIAKTTRGKFDDLEREVRALHSYDTPEIVAVPIVKGSAPYLEWLSKAGSS